MCGHIKLSYHDSSPDAAGDMLEPAAKQMEGFEYDCHTPDQPLICLLTCSRPAAFLLAGRLNQRRHAFVLRR